MASAHPLRWRIEEAGLTWLWARSKRLGPERGSDMGARVFRRLGPLSPFHAIARRNIAKALPALHGAERAAVLGGMWDNLGRVAAEYPHLHALVSMPEPQLSGLAHLQAALEQGRGAILALAHLGNWELGPVLLDKLGLRFSTVYRPPNNPLVAERLARMRNAYPPDALIAKGEGAGAKLAAALRRNEIAGILADQRDRGGIVLPFLGRPAPTTTAPARLALATGAPILPARIERIGGTRFAFEIAPPLAVPDGDTAARLAALSLALNQQLEAWVRARPEQWLWVHRRWG